MQGLRTHLAVVPTGVRGRATTPKEGGACLETAARLWQTGRYFACESRPNLRPRPHSSALRRYLAFCDAHHWDHIALAVARTH